MTVCLHYQSYVNYSQIIDSPQLQKSRLIPIQQIQCLLPSQIKDQLKWIEIFLFIVYTMLNAWVGEVLDIVYASL